MPLPISTPVKDPVPIVQEAGWAPGLVWTGAENLAPPVFDPQTIQPIASCCTNWKVLCTTYSQPVIDANQTPKPVAQHPNCILPGMAQLWILCSSIKFPSRNFITCNLSALNTQLQHDLLCLGFVVTLCGRCYVLY
jgi:hypothetical protein